MNYREVVCTAGITSEGKWIRLYPVPYRYLESSKWFRFHQWIEVVVERPRNDRRPESYRPDLKSIKIATPPFDAKSDKVWTKRKNIVLPTVRFQSLEEIETAYTNGQTSLAIFKPKRVLDFISEPDTKDWSPKQLQQLIQLRLLDSQPKDLEKIPFKFSYTFLCEGSQCKRTPKNPHKLTIIDWQVFQLYRNVSKNYPYAMDKVLEKVRDKWLGEMWDKKRDSYLIVGNHYPWPTFMVLGVFWPPKQNQRMLPL